MMKASGLPTEAFGRYVLLAPIARGGMATVHMARLVGAEGFTRLVAAKRLLPQLASDPDFVTMFCDEARIASTIHHPNVVAVIDLVVAGNEIVLVQDYVHGVPLSQLLKASIASGEPINPTIAVAVMSGVLSGLHGAHDATDELGEPLGIVHRDVSPQNVIVGLDGIPRLVDFGIAKARTSEHHTREGFFKGKLGYMSPEQMRCEPVSRLADIYAAGVLLWELLVGRRFYDGKSEVDFVRAVVSGEAPTLTRALHDVRERVDDDRWDHLAMLECHVARAMAIDAERRFATASAFQSAILEACPPATPVEVAAWVRRAGASFIAERRRVLVENEESYRAMSRFARVADVAGAMKLSAPPARPSEVTVDAPDRVHALDLHRDAYTPGTPSHARPSETGRRAREAALTTPMASFVPAGALESGRLLPWVVSGILMLIVGVLLGAVVVRPREPVVVTAAASPAPAVTTYTTPSVPLSATVAVAPTVALPPSPVPSAVPSAPPVGLAPPNREAHPDAGARLHPGTRSLR